VAVSHRVTNLTASSADVQSHAERPTRPRASWSGQPDQNFIFAYISEDYVRVFSHPDRKDFTKETTWKEYTRRKSFGRYVAGTQSGYSTQCQPIPFDPKEMTPRVDAKVYGVELKPATENRRIAGW